MTKDKKYVGISNGKEYDVRKPVKGNDGTLTALCQADEWIGWLRCRFDSIIGF